VDHVHPQQPISGAIAAPSALCRCVYSQSRPARPRGHPGIPGPRISSSRTWLSTCLAVSVSFVIASCAGDAIGALKAQSF
jgi:hypothetical protein